MPKNTTIIIGIGNPWRHDDGIGHAVIAELSKQQNFPFDLYDGGTDGLALLDVIQKYQAAILIDAVNMGASPGTVRVFTPEEAKIKIQNDALSTHGFGIAEVIKLIEQLNIPVKLKIIGIQPQDISFGFGLSEKIASKITEIISLLPC